MIELLFVKAFPYFNLVTFREASNFSSKIYFRKSFTFDDKKYSNFESEYNSSPTPYTSAVQTPIISPIEKPVRNERPLECKYRPVRAEYEPVNKSVRIRETNTAPPSNMASMVIREVDLTRDSIKVKSETINNTGNETSTSTIIEWYPKVIINRILHLGSLFNLFVILFGVKKKTVWLPRDIFE
jgi:hypothetical protein